MRDRRHVGDGDYLNSHRLDGPNRRLTAGTGAFDEDLDGRHPIVRRLSGRRSGCLTSGEGRAPASPAETDRAATGPGEDIPLLIGQRHNRVVERRVYVGLSP